MASMGDPVVLIYDEQCAAYAASGHPERPQRVLSSAARLREQTKISFEWHAPRLAPREAILRAHRLAHHDAVATQNQAFDEDTPSHEGIYHHALRAAGGAMDAMTHATGGKKAFSLLRPPGHHATPERAMGFCYFNSMGIAVLEAVHQKGLRVAVFDFDVHHGNGTEEMLLGCPETLFVSVHQSPCYPGTGLVHRPPNARNYPIRPHTEAKDHRAALLRALEDVHAFQPDLVGVSAGFDAYRLDPLAQASLEIEDYLWIGENGRMVHRINYKHGPFVMTLWSKFVEGDTYEVKLKPKSDAHRVILERNGSGLRMEHLDLMNPVAEFSGIEESQVPELFASDLAWATKNMDKLEKKA